MSPSDPSTWKLPRLRIDREGAWLHEDEEITHAGILANLWSNLRVDAGGHFLQLGPLRIPVEVPGAPFVVVRVEREGVALLLTLGDQTREPLRPETLRLGAGEVPYCRVKDGRFEARFSRAATYQLLGFMESGESGAAATLVVDEARYPIMRREASPGEAAQES